MLQEGNGTGVLVHNMEFQGTVTECVMTRKKSDVM